jgi:hypothetical protein
MRMLRRAFHSKVTTVVTSVFVFLYCGAFSDDDCPCNVISLTSILATFTRNSLLFLYICMHLKWNLYDLSLLKVPVWILGINRIGIIEAACVQYIL